MRRLWVAVGLITAMSDAFAGEFELPVLRGSEGFAPIENPYRWNGPYFGVHFGYSSAGADYGQGVSDVAAFIARDTVLQPVVGSMTTLAKSDTNGTSFGGFAGYNFQFEDAVLGFEVNYSRMSLNGGATDSHPPVIYANDAGAPPGHHFVYRFLTVDGTATVRVTDLMTFRARAGWAAGQFLPYAFVGFAIARADVTRSARVRFTRQDFPDPTDPPIDPIPDAPFDQSRTEVKDGGFYGGYTGGLGLEWAVFPNVFLRGEWEHLVLPNIQGLGININTFRAGIGMRF
jgi:outer membrane immunogenic protein